MQVSQKQTVNIDFRNITYTVNSKKRSNILRGVNGNFCSGNLIGILGPSGAGKTTLLNILAGYINRNVGGVINVNDQLRDMRKFKKLSCYIMQDDAVQKQLSVIEIMVLVADLKLGNQFTTKEKCKIIDTVLIVIGLKSCANTRTECLSKGELKRLSIALELINNPPVMFLDEPTTGLDNVAAKQCIEVLKVLSNQGRTIICTIHQPSDSLFSLFDQIYCLASGRCVYSGDVSQMVPFFEDLSLPCPKTYSPADYIIEVVSNNEEVIAVFSEAIKNGLVMKNDPMNEKIEFVYRKNTGEPLVNIHDPEKLETFTNAFHTQVIILLRRMFLQMYRNKLMLIIQIMSHLICSVALGLSFFWIGNDAAQAITNYKFILIITLFYCYTYMMSPVLLFPFEVELIKREYFNRWYSIKSYYIALTISTLPLMISLGIIFNTITYVLTNQPMEMSRFFFFNLMGILLAINAHGVGLTIGSIFHSTAGACVCSMAGLYLVSTSVQGFGYINTLPIVTKVLMLLAYPRHGIVGICIALLRGRPLLKCTDELFCYIRDPEEILQLVGIEDVRFDVCVYILIAFAFSIRILAFLALKRKVAYNSKISCKYF